MLYVQKDASVFKPFTIVQLYTLFGNAVASSLPGSELMTVTFSITGNVVYLMSARIVVKFCFEIKQNGTKKSR